MAAKKPAKTSAVAVAPAAAPALDSGPSTLDANPLPDSPLAVSLAVAAAKPVENPAPFLRLITFDQILVDGKLGGKPADLLAKRPELIPHVVDLFRAREAKLLEQHTAALARASGSQL